MFQLHSSFHWTAGISPGRHSATFRCTLLFIEQKRLSLASISTQRVALFFSLNQREETMRSWGLSRDIPVALFFSLNMLTPVLALAAPTFSCTLLFIEPERVELHDPDFLSLLVALFFSLNWGRLASLSYRSATSVALFFSLNHEWVQATHRPGLREGCTLLFIEPEAFDDGVARLVFVVALFFSLNRVLSTMGYTKPIRLLVALFFSLNAMVATYLEFLRKMCLLVALFFSLNVLFRLVNKGVREILVALFFSLNLRFQPARGVCWAWVALFFSLNHSNGYSTSWISVELHSSFHWT